MDEFNETILFTLNEDSCLEECQVPDSIDTWTLEDFDDVFE